MAFRRRRRRSRLSWFPPIGTPFAIDGQNRETGLVTFRVDALASGDFNFIEFPLTFDSSQERLLEPVLNVTMSLSDLMNTGWRCRRVVGKIHAAFFPGNLPDTNAFEGLTDAVPACVFSAGLMVRKVGADNDVLAQNVNLLDRDDYDDPWIWRRTWVLGQNFRHQLTSGAPLSSAAEFSTIVGARTNQNQVGFAFFPQSNAHYGSVMDGPHVDAKTNRIIGPEDRLFLHFATKAMPIQPQVQYATDSSVVGVYDLRLLGSIQKATNRRNASR